MLHRKKLRRFLVPPNAGEKLLADRRMRGKRIEIINTINLCRKRTKLSKAKIKRLPKPAGHLPE